MKLPSQCGTNEDDKLPGIYSKLDPCVLIIASESKYVHVRLNPYHEELVEVARAKISELRDTMDMGVWRKQAVYSLDKMQAAPNTSFDENGNPGNPRGYHWCSRIETACRQDHTAIVQWRSYLE